MRVERPTVTPSRRGPSAGEPRWTVPRAYRPDWRHLIPSSRPLRPPSPGAALTDSKCVTRPAKRRSVTLPCRFARFSVSAPGSACHSPKKGTSEPPAADVRRMSARDTAPPASDLPRVRPRECPASTASLAPFTQQKLEFTRSSFHRVLVRQFGFLSGSQTTDFPRAGEQLPVGTRAIQPPPAKPNASVRSN